MRREPRAASQGLCGQIQVRQEQVSRDCGSSARARKERPAGGRGRQSRGPQAPARVPQPWRGGGASCSACSSCSPAPSRAAPGLSRWFSTRGPLRTRPKQVRAAAGAGLSRGARRAPPGARAQGGRAPGGLQAPFLLPGPGVSPCSVHRRVRSLSMPRAASRPPLRPPRSALHPSLAHDLYW